jgi:hypothetical protein
VNREHGLEGYTGQLKSRKCEQALKDGAKKVWDIRGRSEVVEQDKALNKTHKMHGLTKEVLEGLYVVEGLSDAKIGEQYGMTGEGIAYQRKKFGIASRLPEHRKIVLPEGMITIPEFAKKNSLASRTANEWVVVDGLVASGEVKGAPYYREVELVGMLDKRKKPDDGLFSDEVALRVGMDVRKFRYWAEKYGIVAGGSYGKRDWYRSVDVLEFERRRSEERRENAEV